VVVDVKPGEEVTSVNVGWTVEKFVALQAHVSGAKKASANGHNGTGKKPVKAKASANGSTKRAATKTSSRKTSSSKKKKKASKLAKQPAAKKKK
jgi:hypothetical protein